MYRIAGGELEEVFLENLQDIACKPINKAAVYQPYICEYGIKELKDRFVTYHNNVHQTYNTIIQYPFYSSLLSPGDIASRTGKSAPFSKMDKGQNGTIMTEYDAPTRIKYLKVTDNSNSAYYALYGNSATNGFECRGDKDCIMYGGNGNDSFLTDENSNDYVIKDFKHNKNSDQIVIKGNGSNSALNSVEYEVAKDGIIKLTATCGSCQATEDQKEVINRDIYLEGVTEKEVEGWVRTAIANTQLEKEQWGKTPIIIN